MDSICNDTVVVRLPESRLLAGGLGEFSRGAFCCDENWGRKCILLLGFVSIQVPSAWSVRA